ncbi:MAG: HAD family hydrolase [Ruminococcaceae bacterium]|nr:HAD family hydrolase [Oscillospiraceae bacterium]
MIKAVLFDLDGTLAPMDQDMFIKKYFGALAKKFASRGYDAEDFSKNIWLGTRAMVSNDGSKTNEEAFWSFFTGVYGEQGKQDLPIFEDFYINDFPSVGKEICTPNPDAHKAVEYIKSKGLRISLATNPLFPSIATEERIRWAGFEPSDFEDYTTYENCRYCKPNINYYIEVLDKLGLKAEECLMVGNDTIEDTVPLELGMKVFLITKHLLNKDNRDISVYPNGDFNDLVEYIKNEIQ